MNTVDLSQCEAWLVTGSQNLYGAEVPEFVARFASETLRINPKLKPMQPALLDKHFLRKHRANAIYGQS